MPRYAAFLRGINVGGRSAKSATLQAVFKSLGFGEVSTYIQSGNVIFSTEEHNRRAIAGKAEETLRETLGYSVPVFIRRIEELERIVKNDPFHNREKGSIALLVTLLPAPLQEFPLHLPFRIPKSTAEVISADGAEVYSVTHVRGESALPNPFLESSLGVKATTRNMNVIREIAKKYGTQAEAAGWQL